MLYSACIKHVIIMKRQSKHRDDQAGSVMFIVMIVSWQQAMRSKTPVVQGL